MNGQKHRFINDTDAVSELVGEMLMTGIAVLACAIIAVFVFSYAQSQESVYADIQGWVNEDSDTVYLRHAGGQAVDISGTLIILDVNGTRRELSSSNLVNLKGSSIWQLGEVISINVSGLWGDSINSDSYISTTILDVNTNMVINSGTLTGNSGYTGGGSGNATPPTEPPEPVVTSGLMAWWKLDESTGSIAYDSVGTYSGTIYGAGRINGVSGNALSFDGNDYAEINNRIIEGYPFTIGVWLRTTSSSSQAVVNLAYSGSTKSYYGIEIASGGAVRSVARNTNARYINGVQVNDGQWHHIVAVYSSASSRILYVDGMLNGISSSSSTFNVNSNRWSFGRWGDSTPSNYFTGDIDEVRLWNRALNSTEVQQLYMNP